MFYAAQFAAEQLAALAAGRAKIGKDLTGFDVQATFPLVVGPDPVTCADPVRPFAALYVGGMGSRTTNFYNNLATRMGYAAEAADIQDLYLHHRQGEAMARVPAEFIDRTSLLGDRARLHDRLAELAESGLTTCAVTPIGRDLDTKLAALDTLAAAR